MILNDLTTNDDSILDDGFLVRDTIASDDVLMEYLLKAIRLPNIKEAKETKVREYILAILYRVFQRHPELKEKVSEVVGAHIKRLELGINLYKDRAESLKHEHELANLVLIAPTREMAKNFPTIAPVSSDPDKQINQANQEEHK